MVVYLASDHAGFKLKEALKKYLSGLGYEIKDFGAFEYDEKDDYPDFIRPLAEAVSKEGWGIILGASGQGEAMVANRFKGIRAAVLNHFSEDIIKLSREHNDSNVLSLGARFLTEEEAKKAVKIWLEASFSNEERHVRRIGKIDLN